MVRRLIEIGPSNFAYRDVQAHPTVKPLAVTRVTGLTMAAFNGSLAQVNGRIVLAYRNALAGSSIFVVPLDPHTLQPCGDSRLLKITHPLADGGQEDPRFFWYHGRLHVAFSGVQMTGRQVTVHVLFAELDNDTLEVRRTWQPAYAGRATWEKNWGPFEWAGELFSVYKPGPTHSVLHHLGEGAYPFAARVWGSRWTGGEMRGGAAPVAVWDAGNPACGAEFWSFFHGWTPHPNGAEYTAGLYTFETKPPFRPMRIIPEPLLRDDSSQRPREENPAVYPCGAIRDGDDWLISYGLHNSHVEIAKFAHADLEAKLENV